MAHYLSHKDRLLTKDCYRRGSESDEWLRLFLSGRISRRSCTTCHYQTMDRVGDITLGDIWETGISKLDDNKGTTLVHVWTSKGQELINSIKNNIRCVGYPIEKSRGTERKNTIDLKSNREILFKDVNVLSPEDFFAKYAPYNVKTKFKNISRFILWKFGLQAMVRHIKHLIIHRK